MKPAHVAAALLVAVIWGVAFVVTKVGLETFTPAQLTLLRFLAASAAVLWVPRPAVSTPMLAAIGMTVFAGQFLLQFFGMAAGMPAGLTAVVSQMQALFTVLLAALLLGDRPQGRQLAGMAVALCGLGLIGMSLGAGATVIGFLLVLGSALSWATGNVLVKRLPRQNMLHLMAWASLVPPLPALALALLLDGPASLAHGIAAASWEAWAAPLYLGVCATVLAYAIWGKLLQQYSAGAVAPFALLAPCVGALASATVLGESFPPLRLFGMIAILAGVAVVAVPWRLPVRVAPAPRNAC